MQKQYITEEELQTIMGKGLRDYPKLQSGTQGAGLHHNRRQAPHSLYGEEVLRLRHKRCWRW